MTQHHTTIKPAQSIWLVSKGQLEKFGHKSPAETKQVLQGVSVIRECIPQGRGHQ